MNEEILEIFEFLEQSPYFYEKRDTFIAEPGGVENNRVIYTFYAQENPCQVVAEIAIPLTDPFEEIYWKYIQVNDFNNKQIVQISNERIDVIPNWFKSLIQKVSNMYNDFTIILREFA